MSERNVIQTTFDEFGRSSCDAKKSGSRYRRSSETIVVLNPQKSQYARRYYINFELWLLAVGDADAPKTHECHVQTRLSRLVPQDLEARLDALLDIDAPIDDVQRRKELLEVMRGNLLPLIDASSTVAELRAGTGKRLVGRSRLTGPAQRLLQSQPI